MSVSPLDCMGCGECVTVCPKAGEAIKMVPQESQSAEQPVFDYLVANVGKKEIKPALVETPIGFGGTMLYTARSEEFATPAGIKKAADFCRSIDVSGVVVIGGDGSFKGARALTNAGINCIGIPGTIDNDIA